MGLSGRSALLAIGAALAFAVVGPPAATAVGAEPQVVAHRAGAGGAPEQTAAAIERAVAMRPDRIEVDVQLSSDGVPVLVHDKTFARTTNVATVFPGRANDPVGSFSYAEIKRLDAGSWFGAKFAGQRIPRLAAVVDFLDGTGVGLYLELKNPATSPGLERAVDAVLAADYRWRGVSITFLSFDESSLERMAKLRPGQRLLSLDSDVGSTVELKRLAGWADILGVDYRELDEAEARRVRDAGLRLAVYTVDTRAAQAWARSIGVDVIVTDFPEWLLR